MRRVRFDPWIGGPILILLAVSLIVLRSMVPEDSARQVLFVAIAVAVYFLVAQLDYRILGKLSNVLYVFALALLLVTISLGRVTRGSVRWLEIGQLTIQPSELVKPVLIIFLASFVLKHSLKEGKNVFWFAILTAVPALLVYLQPDLGSSLVLWVIGISIAFASGISLKVFASTLLAMIVAVPLMFAILKPYQQDRLRAFIDPFADPLGGGYHVIQSMIAVGSGELFGRGLGHGTQSQLRFLPERHSDFIFASLSEELGFIGGGLVLLSYSVLIYRLLSGLKNGSDALGVQILTGVICMLLFQVSVNIGMNMGLLPITGVTLPLISSGGSSLLATTASLGIAQSVLSRGTKNQIFEIR